MDNDRWSIGPGDDSSSSTPLSDVIKLTVVLVAVLILSLGIVGSSIFFIWMCFLHPDATSSIMAAVIPAASALLTAWAGKTAVSKALKNKDDKKE